jgi:hypothetical protein
MPLSAFRVGAISPPTSFAERLMVSRSYYLENLLELDCPKAASKMMFANDGYNSG